MKKITDYIKEYKTQQAKGLMRQHFEVYKSKETKDEIFKNFGWYYSEFVKWLYEISGIIKIDLGALDPNDFGISFNKWKEALLEYVNKKWISNMLYMVVWNIPHPNIMAFSNNESLKIFQEFSRWTNKLKEYKQKQLEILSREDTKRWADMKKEDKLWELNINKSFIDEKIIKGLIMEPMKTKLLQVAVYNRSILNTLSTMYQNNVIAYTNSLEQQYWTNNPDVKYLKDIIAVQINYYNELVKLPWHLEISLQNGRWYLNYSIKNILLTAVLDKFKNINMDYVLSVFSWIDYMFNDLYYWKNMQVDSVDFLYKYLNDKEINLLYINENI